MKVSLIIAVLLGLGGAAAAQDFAGLQGLGAGAIAALAGKNATPQVSALDIRQASDFQAPAGDRCELSGRQGDLCRYACASGRVAVEPPVFIGPADGKREAVCADSVTLVRPAPRAAAAARGLQDMNQLEWTRFIQIVREREFDDDHLSPGERREVLAEWLRRNPEDKDKLTGEMNADYVNLVLGLGRTARASRTEQDWQSVDLEAADGSVISVDYTPANLGSKITATKVWVSVRNPAFTGRERVTARLSNFYEATEYSAEGLQTASELALPFNGWNFQAQFPQVSIFEGHHSWSHNFVQEIEVSVDGRRLQPKAGSFRFRMALPAADGRKSAAAGAASVSGSLAGDEIALNYDKNAGLITGKSFGFPAYVQIDRPGRSIKGRLNNADVDLKMFYSSSVDAVKGVANGNSLRYTVNWETGVAEGMVGDKPVVLTLTPAVPGPNDASVRIEGYANGLYLELEYDRSSGRVTGQAGRGVADLKLEGWDIKDFVRFYFLFMGPR